MVGVGCSCVSYIPSSGAVVSIKVVSSAPTTNVPALG